ncbi:DUF2851 domain-containing protein [Sphingobacteriales bacterium UPWRP_1]|nr:hypothetical protein B6N25_08030 [Sphingobacteriales bacterium TSM_CSS]PSJ77336.1 DUF2851 domain-containing protein [Sphingobacteriales bacterium UPWRP_1]
MTEAFLWYVWKMRLYKPDALTTTTGEPVAVIQPGEQHNTSGPDFFNAKIRIADTLWAGNVEVHLSASDWLKHRHQHDGAYQNIILHVVHDADVPLVNNSGIPIPTLELRNLIDPKLYRNYLLLLSDTRWIPCEKMITQIDSFTLSNWADRLLIERLEQKVQPVLHALEQNLHNWDETFYRFLARGLGAKVNAEPFEQLAKSLPALVLAKHKDRLFQLEALLFGQSGLLPSEPKEDYPTQLRKEYLFLRQKYNLQPLPGHIWKFGGLRPPNFPTIRLAQLALLIHQSAEGLFSQILEAETIEGYRKLLSASLQGYWQNHFVFDKESRSSAKRMGNAAIDTIIINTIAPMLFVYGTLRDVPQLKDRALQLLEQLPPEINSIIEHWNNLGIKTETAYQTQAFLQLYNYYCRHKNCLQCAIGNKLVRSMREGK